MARKRALKRGTLFIAVTMAAIVVGLGFRYLTGSKKTGLTRDHLAEALREPATFYQFPTEVTIPMDDELHPSRGSPIQVKTKVEYSFDPSLQTFMQDLIHSYGPDYGAFVAMEADTGKVLSMVSFSRKQGFNENLALRATFPSASVFKVVTAAAAIEGKKMSAESVISFNGRNHTLYRGNVLKSSVTRWTRYITLKEAFARSVNTVFGKIGAFNIGPVGLRQYADRFGFDRRIASDFPMSPGHADIPNDPFGLAESASGFTKENTMSPMQGALIAATLANDGMMMEPYIVQSVHLESGKSIYSASPHKNGLVVDPETAQELRQMMRETVKRGTSSGTFRGFAKGPYKEIEVGGKTGSLTGNSPKGRYDWFVGYAQMGDRKIAIASLTVHEKLWRVKSSYLARRAIEHYFKKHGKLKE